LIYLHQVVVNPKNQNRPTETSAGGGDLEGRAQIVNAVFPGRCGDAAKPEDSASTPNAITRREAAPNDMIEATAV
jgi:hypothetical protein